MGRPCFVWLCALLTHTAAGQVLVNEVMASNHGAVHAPDGSTPDWLELFNAGPGTRDLSGWRLVLNERQHSFPEGTTLRPGCHLLLWCDGDDGSGHLPFRLPREGGTLLLLDPSGTSIHDVFTYPALGPEVSFGRVPDGSAIGSYLKEPSPGSNAPSGGGMRAPIPPPVIVSHPGTASYVIESAPGDIIRYTLDGSLPDTLNGMRYAGPLPMVSGQVLRALATRPGHLPSAVTMAMDPPPGADTGDLPLMMIALDPADLNGPERGIDTPGHHENNTRKGREWERACQVAMKDGSGTDRPLIAGMRVAGSGSRGSPKRSFKLLLKDRFGSHSDTFSMGPAQGLDECLLRADAAPRAFLQHLLIASAAREARLEVDLQRSEPVWLLVNGEARGLYRVMPPKDAQWIGRLHDVGDLDLLEGPAQVALEGDRDHWEETLELLLSDSSGRGLARRVDLASLVDLACMDLYTGRADHELNVRLWRPRTPEGRWRWVLFDLDLWAPASENTVQRMQLAQVPATPYVPRLLAVPGLQDRLLARFASLMQGPFSPEHMTACLDSLMGRYGPALIADHERWGMQLNGHPDPMASADHLRKFVERRPAGMMEYLAIATGRELIRLRTSCDPEEGGHLTLEGVPASARSHQFAGTPLTITAVVNEGWEFAGWKGMEERSAVVVVDPAHQRQVRALFRRAGSRADLP